MTGFLTLLALAVVTWAFRVTFTAVVPADRLPAAVRSRTDAAGIAAFAALLASDLSGRPSVELPSTLAALAAAALAARRTGNHVAAVAAGVGGWSVVAILT